MSPTEPTQAQRRLSWALSIVGACMLLSGVLYFTSSTVGGRVKEFRNRRRYDEVKQHAHEAFPIAGALGFSGLALLILGSRLRSSEERDS